MQPSTGAPTTEKEQQGIYPYEVYITTNQFKVLNINNIVYYHAILNPIDIYGKVHIGVFASSSNCMPNCKPFINYVIH